MAREKRTKPCSNCKKSKVKCIYIDSLPCERCSKSGQISSCQFVPKLPTLKLPIMRSPEAQPMSVTKGNDIKLPPINMLSSVSPSIQPEDNRIVTNGYIAPIQEPNSSQWKSQIENKMSGFDIRLNDLVEVMKANQRLLMENQQLYNRQLPNARMYEYHDSDSQRQKVDNGLINTSRASLTDDELVQSDIYAIRQDDINQNRSLKRGISDEELNTEPNTYEKKRSKSTQSFTNVLTDQVQYPDDFRDGFLNKQEAQELLDFFDSNISPQLFGFEISKVSIDSIWEISPILICAIATIASMHHPSKFYSDKSTQFQKYLHKLSGELLYKGKPKNELEGFNTIVALILCSFWLSDSQMFTGLAFQIAKEIRLDIPNFGKQRSKLSERDRIKLWYLLYALDGQQSLTFNRQPLINSNEYSLKNSREFLLGEKKSTLHLNDDQKFLEEEKNSLVTKNGSYDENEARMISKAEKLTDMRLVSQVEYNQALNDAFSGDAWDLLAPSSFGIPSKSNLELDKWMVSWTVLLAPGNNGTVWSSKSTLIYYNFAKMHINSVAVRQLKAYAGDDKNLLPKWNNSNAAKIGPKLYKKITEEKDSDDSSDEEDEFMSNKDVLSDDEGVVNANIAANAAQTVLNLVLNDKDIINNLKYVPVHIHIMLYYAALLLINPPTESNDKSINFGPDEFFNKLIANLKIVKNLQKRIYLNLPADKRFGDRLIKSLDEVIDEKITRVKAELNEPTNNLSHTSKENLHNELRSVIEMNLSDSVIELVKSPGNIAAWPGSDHGHP